jgi:hypothetical protein
MRSLFILTVLRDVALMTFDVVENQAEFQWNNLYLFFIVLKS